MERIDVAELIRNCPSGMELDCTMYDNLHFDKVDDYDKKIHCYIQYKDHRTHIMFGKDGTYNIEKASKCVIFPKGKTTWEGFVPPSQFKDGDIVAYDNKLGVELFIFKEFVGNATAVCYLYLNSHTELHIVETPYLINRLATEEEKEKLFDYIKAHGYKWNPETKALEKLIESKENTDNVAVMSGIYFDREYYADEVELHLNNYEIEVRNGKTYAIFKNQETKTLKPKFKVGDRIRHKCPEFRGERIVNICCDTGYFTTINDWIDIEHQDDWELVPVEPKFKVGDKIFNVLRKSMGALGTFQGTISEITDDKYIFTDGSYMFINSQDNYELVSDKFDITSLKTFDQVLVRDFDNTPWEIEFFSRLLDGKHFKCSGLSYMQCIPYKGNEHLNGKKDDCDKYFKTWE